MNRIIVWCFTGLIGVALPLYLHTSEDKHAEHGTHESAQCEGQTEGGVNQATRHQEMVGVVVESIHYTIS